ncbi:MAG: chorismate mutase [Gracilibacteraceae bacterium]|jgi:chorismate mutase|nr:chorismate mutase [Gracilibacteraceae bacterium]
MDEIAGAAAELARWRQEIDRVDADLTRLFEERMNLARRVAVVKKRYNLPLYQPEREEAVLIRARAALREPELAAALTRWFRVLINAAKDWQAGTDGAPASEAAPAACPREEN